MTGVVRLASSVNVVGWGVVLGAFVLWQVVMSAGLMDFQYIPSPLEILAAFPELIGAGEFWTAIAHTLQVTLVATVLALVLGIGLGVLLGRVLAVRLLFSGSVDILRSVSTVALMPVALLLWGPAAQAEIIVATYAAVWPMVVNVSGALRSTHPRLDDVADVLELSPMARVRKIAIPAVLPAVLVGARLAVITALMVAIVAEMIITPEGIGFALVKAQLALQPAQLWAWMITAALIGYLLNLLLIGLAKWVPGSAVLAGDRQ